MIFASLSSLTGITEYVTFFISRGIPASPRAASLNNLQLRLRRRIQQIYSLLEAFILHECSICFLSSLDRGMKAQFWAE